MTKNLIDDKTAELARRDDEIEGRVDNQDTRLTRVEGRVDEVVRDVEHLPTKADLARLEGEVKGVAREVEGVAGGIRRIEGYFLERGVERS